MYSDSELTALLEEIGVSAIIEHDDGSLVVTGIVESDSMRQAALDLLADVEPTLNVVDNLEVDEATLEAVEGIPTLDTESTETILAAEDAPGLEGLEPGDFTDQDIAQDPFTADGPSGTAVDEEINEGEESYIPPIDPVLNRDGEVVGGFAISAMDSVDPERSSDGSIGDEAIADAVRMELTEDSMTADLDVEVEVESGIVHLRGEVATLNDVDSAEEVAGRVTGVREVREHLRVASI